MKTLRGSQLISRLLTLAGFVLIQGMLADSVKAQIPDIFSGTVMYGVFSPTGTNDSTEIRSINYSNGAVGPLMGGKRYYIMKNLGKSPGTNFYGSSAMALSPVTNQFYLFTQMGTGASTGKTNASGPKDIIAINTALPTPTMTVIGTTPTTENDWHIVKAAISPNGWGYAIGVNRLSSAASSTFNPLYRFRVCTTAGCANGAGNFDLLGYLPDTGMMKTMQLFNGDIAFDNVGNLYFLSSAYDITSGRYTDARLFRINSADIPSSAGTGTIPMSFICDFNALDSTGCSGIAFDPSGNMYFSVRRYQNNNPGTGVYTTEVYSSYDTATANLISSFGPVPANTSVGDLASGTFSFGVLARNQVILTGRNVSGTGHLSWSVSNNSEANYFEVQRSADGVHYQSIGNVQVQNSNSPNGTYAFTDQSVTAEKYLYYRIREVMQSGQASYYSNVSKILFNANLALTGKISPNPFDDHFECSIQLNSPVQFKWVLRDISGRIVRQELQVGKVGVNRIFVSGLSALQPGVYLWDVSAGAEMIRQKLVKQ